MTSTELILRDLVAFDTTSAKSNLDLIAYVQRYLASHGLASRLIPDQTGTKANLWATIGPEVDGGLVLSGHTDCVPVVGEIWQSDPFTLTERGGRLHGRHVRLINIGPRRWRHGGLRHCGRHLASRRRQHARDRVSSRFALT